VEVKAWGSGFARVERCHGMIVRFRAEIFGKE